MIYVPQPAAGPLGLLPERAALYCFRVPQSYSDRLSLHHDSPVFVQGPLSASPVPSSVTRFILPSFLPLFCGLNLVAVPILTVAGVEPPLNHVLLSSLHIHTEDSRAHPFGADSVGSLRPFPPPDSQTASTPTLPRHVLHPKTCAPRRMPESYFGFLRPPPSFFSSPLDSPLCQLYHCFPPHFPSLNSPSNNGNSEERTERILLPVHPPLSGLQPQPWSPTQLSTTLPSPTT